MGNAPESMVDPDGLQYVNVQKAQAVTDDNVGGWATDLNFALWGRKSNGGNNGYGANQGTGGGGYGGASDQIFLYGEQAQATWAKLTGQPYTPNGEGPSDVAIDGYQAEDGTHVLVFDSGKKKNPTPSGKTKTGGSSVSPIDIRGNRLEQLLGPALVASGAEIVPKSSTLAKAIWSESRWIKGSKPNTSIVSLLSRRFLNSVKPVSWLPKSISLGGQLGRLGSASNIVLGTAISLYEIYNDYNQYQVDPDELFRQWRLDVTTIGMYHNR
jgi:hypothetical protein